MKVVVSYRRDDTGGRAGRLADALVDRLGARNVFQDVDAVAPGADFPPVVERAIRESDAVLVVMGPAWLGADDGAGTRRIDRPDDFVRQEIGAALAADRVVVPVLVGGARLPVADELPDDLRPLLHRNAVALRDESWHQDVDELIRRLSGEGTRTDDRRHRRRLLVGAALVVAAVGGAALVVALTRDDGGDDASTSDSGELTGCPGASAAYVHGTVAAGSTGKFTTDVRTADVAVLDVARRLDSDGDPEVYVTLKMTNTTPADVGPDAGSLDMTRALVDAVLVDQIAQTELWCDTVIGAESLPPGQSAMIKFGWDVDVDPVGADIAVALSDDTVLPAGTL